MNISKPMNRLYNSSYNNQKFWRWNNWQAWLVVILFPVIAFPLYRYIQSQVQKNASATTDIQKAQNLLENQNPDTLQAKLDKINPSKAVQSAAKQLTVLLGTKYSDAGNWYDFFNPRGWTEDDQAVADLIIYQRNNYKLLVKMYYIVSNSRSLSNDLLTLLDPDQIKRVQKYISI